MQFLRRLFHFFIPCAASVFYRHPSRELFVIGVTGTKGKSTSAELIATLLEAGGRTVALLSTVRVKIGKDETMNETRNTMPGRFFIQRFLRRAANAGVTHAVLEVTSQGVMQSRHRFIDFDAAVFLNLHPEHIEAHGSFDEYRGAKVDFFRDVARRSKKAKKYFFLNHADPSARYFFAAVDGMGEIYYFSREEFVRSFFGRRGNVSAWLHTDFNLENAAAAVKVAEVAGIDAAAIARVMKSFSGVPGRMEVVQHEPFRVIVDYAHTPDSLEAVYNSLTSKTIKRSRTSRLICVLGAAGGGRDTWKRPAMGRIAAQYCTVVFFTNEDPYDEDPAAIMEAVERGFVEREEKRGRTLPHHEVVLDRRAAIERALKRARRGDIVIITGKGSESAIRSTGGRRTPWSDRGAVEEILAARKTKT